MMTANDSIHQPCMGRFLSRGCPKGSIHFFVRQFLCSTWQPFLRPDPHIDAPARAGAVKAGRIFAATEGLALDGAEHAGTLGRVGMTKSEGSPRVVHEGSCHILVFGGREAQTMMQ
jgi:hypothetical protein